MLYEQYMKLYKYNYTCTDIYIYIAAMGNVEKNLRPQRYRAAPSVEAAQISSGNDVSPIKNGALLMVHVGGYVLNIC